MGEQGAAGCTRESGTCEYCRDGCDAKPGWFLPGTRHTFGGLTDSAFRLIPMLEAGRDARWDDLFATA